MPARCIRSRFRRPTRWPLAVVSGSSALLEVELPNPLFVAKRFAEGVMHAAKAAKRLVVAQQVDDTRMLLPGRRNDYEQLTAGAELGQACLQVGAKRVQLRCRQQPVFECRLAEPAQQRAPVVVRTEQVI